MTSSSLSTSDSSVGNFLTHLFHDVPIKQREQDGFVDGTAMSNAGQERAFFNKIKKNGNRNLQLYDLSKSVYWSSTRDIDMYCKQHGLFKLPPSNFIGGVGCDKCESTALNFLLVSDDSAALRYNT